VTAFGFPLEGDDLVSQLAGIPVRTRLVEAGEDLAALVAEAVASIASAGAVVALSETAVAIAQGRAISAATIRPSRLAYALSTRAGVLATVNQPESLQLVIESAGLPKVLWAAFCHVVGRLIGLRGLFYRVLGSEIAVIDGYTGTLPPFEGTIVLGPERPEEVAQAIADRCGPGVGAVVVDANDLGKAVVLGASHGVATELVTRALRSNPHGNGDEQTPIVVLIWRGASKNPLFEELP
jgi:hypothetical protein